MSEELKSKHVRDGYKGHINLVQVNDHERILVYYSEDTQEPDILDKAKFTLTLQECVLCTDKEWGWQNVETQYNVQIDPQNADAVKRAIYGPQEH